MRGDERRDMQLLLSIAAAAMEACQETPLPKLQAALNAWLEAPDAD